MKNWFKQNSYFLGLLTLLVFITYSNTLSNSFLSDDIAEIVNNKQLGSFKYVTDHFYGFIRPLLNFSIYNLFGLEPFFFRLVNIFFHLGNTFIIFALITHLYSRKVAMLVASLFAVHPLISEAVTWISGGLYPQYSFFLLLSLLLYIRGKQVSSLIAFFLSIMSHISSLTLFPILIAYEIAFGSLRKNWKRLIPFLVMVLLWSLFTYTTLGEREITLQQVHYQEKGVDNPLIILPIAISSYLELFVWPDKLTLYHSELGFSNFEFSLRVIITAVFFGLIIYGFFRNKVIFFWLSFFLISLALTLTPFRLTWIVAERYAYLGSIGIFVLFILMTLKLFKKTKWPYRIYLIIFACILIAFSVRTIVRNMDWKSEDTLWLAAARTSPSSPNNHNNLGDYYGRIGNKQRSIEEFQTAIALKPNYADAYHNLGNAYKDNGEADKALQSYQKAAELNPRLWQSHQNMAAIYYEQNKMELSLESINKAISINPQNANLYNNLAVIYFKIGDKDNVKEALEKALQLDPGNQQAKVMLMEIGR